MANKETKSKKKKIVLKKQRKAVKRNAVGIKNVVLSVIMLPRTAVRFLKSVFAELRLVDWLSKKDTTKWSSAVIITALGFGGFIVLVDLVYFELRELLFTI